jgi:hypothetical protein
LYRIIIKIQTDRERGYTDKEAADAVKLLQSKIKEKQQTPLSEESPKLDSNSGWDNPNDSAPKESKAVFNRSAWNI